MRANDLSTGGSAAGNEFGLSRHVAAASPRRIGGTPLGGMDANFTGLWQPPPTCFDIHSERMSTGMLSEGEEIELRRLTDWEQLKIVEQKRKELERLRKAKSGEVEWSKALETASSQSRR